MPQEFKLTLYPIQLRIALALLSLGASRPVARACGHGRNTVASACKAILKQLREQLPGEEAAILEKREKR